MHSQQDNFQWKQYLVYVAPIFFRAVLWLCRKIDFLIVCCKRKSNKQQYWPWKSDLLFSILIKRANVAGQELLDTKCTYVPLHTCVNIPKGPTILHDGAHRILACKFFSTWDYANNGKICQCAALHFTTWFVQNSF